MKTRIEGNGHATTERTPPHDPDAERSALAIVALDPTRAADLFAAVGPDDFHDTGYQKFAGYLFGMTRAGAPIDLIEIRLRMKANGDFDEVGGEAFFHDLLSFDGLTAHLPTYARIIADQARRRRIIDAAEEASEAAYRLDSDAAETITRLRDELSEAARTKTPKLVGRTLAELAAGDYAVEYLVSDCLVVGQPCIVAGPQKSLKTSVAFDLCISLITGADFLGRFAVNRSASVAFFSGEGGFGFLQDVARRVCGFKQVTMSELTGMTVCDSLPRLDNPEDLAGLADYLDKHKPELALFDPIYLSLGGADASNVLSMGERLGNIGRICAEHNATPVLLHHLKRGRDTYAPAELSDLAFSGFPEYAGQWLLLSRRAKYTPSPDAKHELWLSIGGRTGHGGLYGLDVSEGVTGSEAGRYWYPEVIDAGELVERKAEATEERQRNRAAENLDTDRRAIVGAMAKQGEPETKTTIRQRVGIGHERFGRAWQALVDEGVVMESNQGVPKGRGQHYKAWTLANEGGET